MCQQTAGEPIEYFEAARKELLFRVKHRDSWLKLDLLALATMWALARGIKFGPAEARAPVSDVLLLAIPLSLVFAALYFVEDSLVHNLSTFIASRWPASWDASAELRSYARGKSLALRAVGQVAAFIVTPAYLFFLQFGFRCSWSVVVQLVLLAGIVWLIGAGYLQRRGTGRGT